MDSIKIMTMDDLEDAFQFEMARLPGDSIEREMKSWHAPWRRESLNHYLPQGWCFVKRANGGVVGYILCQPVLFYQGWTQTLWIEHVSALQSVVGVELMEVAYRWARDKHLQKVFFRRDLEFANMVSFASIQDEGSLWSLTTTKM